MKRDWKKLEEVLSHAETEDIDDVMNSYGSVSSEDEDIFCGHVLLAIDAGLIAGLSLKKVNDSWIVKSSDARLTMLGHDMLDALRSKTVWGKVKELAVEARVPVTIELINKAMSLLVRQMG